MAYLRSLLRRQGSTGTPVDVSIVIIRPTPASLAYRPLLHVDRGATLLRRCLQRVCDELPAPVIAIVSFWEAAAYRPSMTDLDVHVWEDSLDTELAAIARAIDGAEHRRILLLYPEAALGPAGFLRDVHRISSSQRADVTVVDGPPAGAIPVAISAGVLAIHAAEVRAAAASGRGVVPSALRAIRALAAKHRLVVGGISVPSAFPRAADRKPWGLAIECEADAISAHRCLDGDRLAETTWCASRAKADGCHAVPMPVTTKARILYVTNASGYTGGQAALVHLVASMRDCPYACSALVAREGTLSQQLRREGCQTISRGIGFNHDDVQTFEYLLSVFRSVQPALIHLNDFSGLQVFRAARALSIPVVFHVRVPGARLLAEALLLADHLIAVSHSTEAELLACGVARSKVTVCYSGVDVARYSPDEAARLASRTALGLSARERLLFMVGRFHPVKRHDLFLGAVRTLLRRGHHVRGMIAGEPDISANTVGHVQRMIGGYQLHGAVQLLPFTSDLVDRYRACDVFVLPSDSEPLGLSAIEAMACGSPVVLTRAGELAEVVARAGSGLVSQCGDAEQLAFAIEQLIADDRDRAARGAAARRLACETFSSTTTASCVAATYDGILARAVG